jgi:hypothetical protein
MEIKYIEGKYIDTETGEIIDGEPGELNMRIVYDKHTVIHFGKHKGKTILQIGGDDPGYIKWMKNTGFKVYDKTDKATITTKRKAIGNAIVRYPSVMLTERGIEDGFDVFARDFKNHMNNHMIDKHPEIFDGGWEENLDCLDPNI